MAKVIIRDSEEADPPFEVSLRQDGDDCVDVIIHRGGEYQVPLEIRKKGDKVGFYRIPLNLEKAKKMGLRYGEDEKFLEV